MRKKRNAIRDSREDKILYTIVNIMLALLVIVVAYPLIYILSSSFSSGTAVSTGRVRLLPVDFSLEGYKTVFAHRLIGSAYRNTIFYTVAGTIINIVVTVMCAYPLARKDFPMQKFFSIFFIIVMFFNGGMIPTYMVISKLKLTNTIWAMLLPGAISVYNMILVRTSIINSIPSVLFESAQIDGCSDARYFTDILVPLIKPVIAVITLYYAVGHWNSYFNAMLYLSDEKLYPLQIILRQILVANQISLNDLVDVEAMVAKQGLADVLKYALIVVSTVPILCIYPFIQRYFIKGAMIGSVKG